ncbi:MAG TPA: sporulation protein YunB [Feifaniaceae bacterium]|nr:sporulation protein YunB [Feifaniaceae bacterium]
MEFRKRRMKRTILIIAGAVLVLLILSYALINAQLRPALIQMGQTRVRAEASKAMYTSVLEQLSEREEDASFVEIQKTQDQVYYVELDSAAINLFAARCADASQEKLTQLGNQGIDLPIGTAMGIPLFAGAGPMLRMTFSPEGAVQTHISSDFRSAGINQTLHRVVLTMSVNVAIILPGSAETDTVTLSMPVAEQIIVGKVPEAYTDVANNEDMLNLVPGVPQ